MLIDVQYAEASDLLHELLRQIPEPRQPGLVERVDRVASSLHHPSTLGAIVCSVGRNSTHEPPIAFGDVVLPLEGTQVVGVV